VALVKGRHALAGGDYQEAAGWLAMALEPAPRTGVQGLLAPEIDQRDARYYRARALYATGRYSEVSDVLEPILKGPARDPEALFLRARAREMQGLSKEAITDYELASRAAFADVGMQFTSGNAHFYRGIALFRRENFERAENAFASALNFEASPELRPDVQAWRHMAAVAGGACHAAASLLQAAIPSTSNLFPKTEADMLLRACRAREVSRVN
jgi:tetratricopeptide (TPR) repeat protein